MIQALIFDYFGVIRPADHGLRAAYRLLGGDTARDEVFIADVTTAGNLGFIQDVDEQLATKLGVPLETWRATIAGVRNNDPELLAYILQLRQKGLKIGLLTNAGAQSLQTYFAAEELPRYFDAALASGDTGFAKPEAAFYRMMAEKLHVSPVSCLMIDDRPEFCSGAEYIGMQSIVYRSFDQFKRELDMLLRD